MLRLFARRLIHFAPAPELDFSTLPTALNPKSMINRSLLSAAIAGVAAVGTVAIVSPAYAAGIKSYNATAYSPNPGAHAFWFNQLPGKGWASSTDFFFDEDGGMFTVDGTTATLMGRIVNGANDNEYFDVNLEFELTGAPASLKGAGLAPGATQAEKTAYAFANWDFYDYSGGSISASGGRYAGSDFTLGQKDYTKAVQVGAFGANDKNKHFGMSTWFKGAGGTFKVDGEVKDVKYLTGDINIKLDPKAVPEPMSLLGLGAAAVGIAGLKRKQS